MASLYGATFAAPGPPGGIQDLTGSGDSTEYIMGLAFQPLVDGQVTAIKFWCPTVDRPNNAAFAVGLTAIPNGVGGAGATVLASEAKTAPSAGQVGTWVTYTLGSPVAVVTTSTYQACVRTNRYAFSTEVFTGLNGYPLTVGNLRARVSDVGGGFPNCAFRSSGLGTLIGAVPNNGSDNFYGIDLEFTAGSGGEEHSGTGSASLPAVSAAAVGSKTAVGAGSATIPTVSMSATGSVGGLLRDITLGRVSLRPGIRTMLAPRVGAAVLREV